MYNIKLYCLENCIYCERAKNLLDSLELKYESDVITRDNLVELSEKTGMYTAPQIFINDKLIGGFDQLNELNNKNQLLTVVNSK